LVPPESTDIVTTLQNLCDTKVEQAHITLFGDQNIAGLQIAVYYQMRVGILHR
jgi:hypothetical protein